MVGELDSTSKPDLSFLLFGPWTIALYNTDTFGSVYFINMYFQMTQHDINFVAEFLRDSFAQFTPVSTFSCLNFCLLVMFADILWKQFGHRPGTTFCRAWSESKLFDSPKKN